MTVTSNIHIGLAAWQSTHAYSVLATRVSHSGNAYQLITTGTSGSTGPTGTTSNITDGSCHWKWLSAADYSSLSAWAASVPNPMTTNIIGLLWNDGPITTTVGVPYFTLNNFASNSTHTITLKCATGESFRDTLANGSTPLAFNANNGVNIQCPSGAGNCSYFNIQNGFVTLDGIQFLSSDPASASNLIALGTSGNITNCLIDGYSQTGNDLIFNAGGTIANTVFFERGADTFEATVVSFGSPLTNIVNCTFVRLNPGTHMAAFTTNASSGANIVRNSIFIGYTSVPIGNSSGAGSTYAIDHCLFSNANNSWMAANAGTDGGGNVFSGTAANQFVSATADFRLKSGSAALNAGTTDTTDIPSADDIAKTSRPQSTAWDIGAWEFIFSTAASAADSFFVITPAISLVQYDQASASLSLLSLTPVVQAGQTSLASTATTLEALQAVIQMGQADVATATATFPLTAVGGLLQADIAMTTVNVDITAVVALTQKDLANGTNSFFRLTATATGQIPVPAAVARTILSLSSVSAFQIPLAASATVAFNIRPTISMLFGQFPYPAAGAANLLTLFGFGTSEFVRYLTAQNSILRLIPVVSSFSQGGDVASANITVLPFTSATSFGVATNPGTLYSYILSWSTTPVGPWNTVGGITVDTSTLVTGLSPNTSYWLRVIPIDNNTNIQGLTNVVGPIVTLP